MKTIKRPPKVAAIHDLSCVGRCALTVVIPILSSLGTQALPLPTAVLSTHTGGYEGYTFLDLSDEMKKIIAHWESIDECFDAVYSGFLGSAEQIDTVSAFVDGVKKREPNALYIADPVMGDDGRIYATYTDEMCDRMIHLVEKADIVTPNLTECARLLGIEYKECYSEDEIHDMLMTLSHGGTKSVVITGISKNRDFSSSAEEGEYPDSLIGAEYFDRETGSFGSAFTPKVRMSYPGTGEAFTSVLTGELLSGESLGDAVKSSVDFVHKAALFTYYGKSEQRAGILLEPCLKYLGKE